MWNDAAAKNTLVPLILRLALAVIFIYHGWHKIADPGNEWGTLWATNLTQKSYFPPPEVLSRLDEWERFDKKQRAEGEVKDKEPLLPDGVSDRIRSAYDVLAKDYQHHPESGALHLQTSLQLLVAWGEFLGGIALLLGLLTRLAALGLIVIQVGAICTVTWESGFSAAGGAGYEYNLALVAMCLALVVLGGGRLSVDRLIWGRRQAAAPGKPEPVAA